MTITDQDLQSFGQSSDGKSVNDRDNKSREKVVAILLNSSESELDSLRRQIRDRELLNELINALHRSITELSNLVQFHFEPENVNAIPKGGRGNNHDFDLVISASGSERTLAVELKKGISIFDQPQFLSLYVNTSAILNDSVKNYAEYFYDENFKELQKYSGCTHVDKDDYLAGVFGTTYENAPFSQLYELVKSSDSARDWFKELQYSSIDKYIQYLLSHSPHPINWTSLQERLFQQLPKFFLSWNSQAKTFKWEQFEKDELTLNGEATTKTKTSGQLTSIVLPTQTGQRLEMLLRWKNNPCVKGPAWQIKLTPP